MPQEDYTPENIGGNMTRLARRATPDALAAVVIYAAELWWLDDFDGGFVVAIERDNCIDGDIDFDYELRQHFCTAHAAFVYADELFATLLNEGA